MNVGVEIDTQFLGGLGQSVEGIPSFHTVGGAGTKADVPFAHALSGRQFGGIVVQGQMGEIEHGEQSLFLGQGLGYASVKIIIAGFLTKEGVEFCSQSVGFWRGRSGLVEQELAIELPELLFEICQLLPMIVHKGMSFL